VCGPDGTPLLSWRVLVLPYLGQEELFAQFRLTEPWDSDHNVRLLDRMPSTYAPPAYKQSLVLPYHTVCTSSSAPGRRLRGRVG
jgi:hypothetical protein